MLVEAAVAVERPWSPVCIVKPGERGSLKGGGDAGWAETGTGEVVGGVLRAVNGRLSPFFAMQIRWGGHRSREGLPLWRGAQQRGETPGVCFTG